MAPFLTRITSTGGGSSAFFGRKKRVAATGNQLNYTSTIPGAPGTLDAANPIIVGGTGSSTSGSAYSLTFNTPGQIEVKAWGAGGGSHDGIYAGGAGGAAAATVDVTGGTTYTVFVGGNGTPATGRNASGAGAGSGFIIASPFTKVVVAGG